MELVIREAKKSDMPNVLNLIHELAAFEKEHNAVVIEGIALVYNRYSTWKGRVIHLEDLIVSQSMRGKGIGSKLLDKVVKYGHNLGVKRISWEVLDWNEPAIAFYEKNGARVMRDWDVVQLSETGIKNYISKLEDANI